jgi:hypothetical protein
MLTSIATWIAADCFEFEIKHATEMIAMEPWNRGTNNHIYSETNEQVIGYNEAYESN